MCNFPSNRDRIRRDLDESNFRIKNHDLNES